MVASMSVHVHKLSRKRVKAVLARAGRWTLVIVVLGFAVIGFLQVTRGIAVHHVEGVGADGVPIGVSEPQFPLVVTMLTGAFLAQGHRVEVTLNGDGTYPRLWEDHRSARQSITLQLYYGALGRMAGTLGEILRERAAAGVRVFILYDAFGTVDIPTDELGAFTSRRRTGRALSSHSIIDAPSRAEPLAHPRHRHR
jgi:hypothetical protein